MGGDMRVRMICVRMDFVRGLRGEGRGGSEGYQSLS